MWGCSSEAISGAVDGGWVLVLWTYRHMTKEIRFQCWLKGGLACTLEGLTSVYSHSGVYMCFSLKSPCELMVTFISSFECLLGYVMPAAGRWRSSAPLTGSSSAFSCVLMWKRLRHFLCELVFLRANFLNRQEVLPSLRGPRLKVRGEYWALSETWLEEKQLRLCTSWVWGQL